MISGAHSNIGKTTLAKSLCEILPGAKFIKIGTGKKKEHCQDILYPYDISFEQIKKHYLDTDYLIIESNRVLIELTPDLCVYLGGDSEKQTAAMAKRKADIIQGAIIEENKILSLSGKLKVSIDVMKQICFLAGAKIQPLSAIILAGGGSSRMGKNKAFLSLNGEYMIVRLYETLNKFFDQIIISVGSKNSIKIPQCITVKDLESGKGPLMGIYSAVSASENFVNFVIACDIPNINFSLIKKLLSFSCQYNIILPSFSPGFYEPLFAVYTKEILKPARTLLNTSNRRVSDLFPLCKTKILTIQDSSWYLNINTPKDYEDYIKAKR